MTTKEFNETEFHKGMKVEYREFLYDIQAIDFELCLFEIRLNHKSKRVECSVCRLVPLKNPR